MKFNHLNIPTHWQNYWTRYPEGHTILEALISWVSQVDSMVDNQNKLNDNVEQFRNEIDDFVGRFDERLQDELTHTLKDWQSSGFLDVLISSALQWQLDNYIATNEQDKLSITTQLQEQEDFIRLKRDKTIFIGDSYGNFPTPESSWIPNTAKLLGIPNEKWYSESEGGAGFTGADGTLYTFKQLLERFETKITDKVNVGQIIVCGGFNDRGQDGTATRITTKIDEFMIYVKEKYPNAEVYIGMIGWSKLSGHTNQLTAVLPAYTRAGNYGAKYLHNVEYVLHNHNLYYDDVHPNLEGSYRLADAIASAIKTGSASVMYETKQFARGYTGAIGVAATTGNFFGSLNNNVSTLRLQRGFIAITSTNIDLTGGTFYKILQITNGYFTGVDTDTVDGITYNNNVFGVGTTCKIGISATDGIDVYAVFYVYDGYLCAKFYRSTGGVYEGVTRIDIPDLIISGDTMTA